VLRLSRLLATLVVLLGLLPCEMREALAAVGERVAACCADAVEAGERDAGEADAADCCGTVACLCATSATAPVPNLRALHPFGFLIVEAPLTVTRPTWNTGPPPTPPPIV
jgi:hypothetical protein